MTENPDPPPRAFVKFTNPSTGAVLIGELNDEAYRWLENHAFTQSSQTTQIGGVVSGVAEVNAKADAAQATANGAQTNVNNLTTSTAGPGALLASISPFTAQGSIPGSGVCSTNSLTVNITGGVAPYFVSWATDLGGFTIGTPSSVTTGFAIFLFDGASEIDTATVTVTDSTPGTPLTTTASAGISATSTSGA